MCYKINIPDVLNFEKKKKDEVGKRSVTVQSSQEVWRNKG